ncbi:hypothetical protein [Sphingobium sp. RAC03]|uniref:hypothetical protein n=1 Tax=Sphingobium sp. RAC03 TaxID=1843368 RepID=UPI00083E62D1|nr:hypothetical protein [Sphingobium sp. RAC03]AOF97869.1 hypothetical protein BSY17_2762 [Sphingobium sp. RAC03]
MTDAAKATTAIPNGVVLVYDPTAIIEVPADTGSGAVLSTKNCVSIWTLHEVDGVVELSFADQISEPSLSLIFEGLLETPGCKLAFNTSACEPIIEVAVAAVQSALSIYTNDLHDPSRVVCIVG